MNTSNHTLISDLGDFPSKGVRHGYHSSQYDNLQHTPPHTLHTPHTPHTQDFFNYRSVTTNEPEMSCRNISLHVEDCPICKKFYDSDNNLYIIIIVVLLIINVYLLRKIK